MNNLTEISVTASVETALKKLKKAQIAVYNVKKEGNTLNFCVRDDNIKKVFAIFTHPCYNVRIRRKSKKNKALSFVVNRIGLFIGCALFVCALAVSQNFIFKVTVTGSGSYLRDEVIRIMREAGVQSGSFYKGVNKPLVQARILALPNVTFCSVSKTGSVVVVDVQTDAEHSDTVSGKPLKSSVRGVIENIVAICGTPMFAAGDVVQVGDTLIAAYNLNAAGERQDCLAVGYAEISVNAVLSTAADEDNEQNAEAALKSTGLYSDNVLRRSINVKPTADGVVYEVEFTYLVTLSVNME